MRWMLVAACGVLLTACDVSAARETASRGTAAKVDSVVSREEALRRFRTGLAPVERLEGGHPSREALLGAMMRALEARDSAALERLTVTRAEFAWLYYATTPQGLPPYDVEPALLWFLLRSRSERSARRALQVYGGRQLEVLGYDCGGAGQREGDNTLFGPCTVRWRSPGGDTAAVRLVGQILEREGRFKILSYSNKL